MSPKTRIDVKTGYWRLTLLAHIQRLELQADSAPLEGVSKARFTQLIDNAEKLMDDTQNPIEWWSGSQVEMAWTQLRLAQECLIQGATHASVIEANASQALFHARGLLADGDGRVTTLTAALTPGSKPPDKAQLEAIRALSLNVTVASHKVSDDQHRAQRKFRNRLRSVSALLSLLAIALIAAAMRVPIPAGWIPTVKGTTPGQVIVGALILGAAGALFSAVPSLTQAPTNTTTFNPKLEQATLKIVVGSWSAIVGLIAVAAGITTADASSASPAGFAMMCALFGASQEALTRFADHKANETAPATS